MEGTERNGFFHATASFHKHDESMQSFGSSRGSIVALISCPHSRSTMIEVRLWEWRFVANREASIIAEPAFFSAGCSRKQCVTKTLMS
jgi:hypothetical protein